MSSLDIIQYPPLSRYNDIIHFTTTRQGGVSSGNFATLNLAVSNFDKVEDKAENYKRLLHYLKIEREQLHLPLQTHSNSIAKIDSGFLQLDEEYQRKSLYGKDALITNLPKQCVAVTTADCVPILMYDPVHKAVAAVHSGWRSCAAEIVVKCIEAMQREYNCKPTDIVAVMGPSISPEAYKVGSELIKEFEAIGIEKELIFNEKEDNLFLDLWKANQIQMERAGILTENIEISGYCTYTEHKRFFSARRLGIKSGRIMSGIMLTRIIHRN